MLDPLLLVFGTILAAGVFGGFVNFYLSKPDDVPTPSKVRSVVVGTAASFLVPLFLNMISSNLIELIKAGDMSKLLVLLGFCLVAAISSTAFIRTLSDRVLSEARQAKKEVQETRAELTELQSAIQPIVAKETESDQAGVTDARALTVPTNEEKILKALSGGRWALRSQSGLAKETTLDSALVARLLNELRTAGLVGARTKENGTRWFITDAGRQRLSGVG
jgi:ABC-type multidrug transport system fused ATPase/permease subunit